MVGKAKYVGKVYLKCPGRGAGRGMRNSKTHITSEEVICFVESGRSGKNTVVAPPDLLESEIIRKSVSKVCMEEQGKRHA